MRHAARPADAGGDRGLPALAEELVTVQNPSMGLAHRNAHLLHRRVAHYAPRGPAREAGLDAGPHDGSIRSA